MTDATNWTCPQCGYEVEVPDPATGILYCPPWDGEGVAPEVPCGMQAVNLDLTTVESVQETGHIVDFDLDPLATPAGALGDCEGCTPEEAREFEARFPQLDTIDREFRLSQQ